MNPLIQTYTQHRYMILFYSLLFSIIAIPVFSTLRIGRVLPFLFVLNLLVAVLPIASGFIRKILLLILLLVLVVQLVINNLYLVGPNIGSLAIWTFIALMAAVYAIKFTLSASTVDSEHIYAALSAYMLAGIFLGHFYWIVETIAPGSFSVGGATSANNFTISSAIYFSFVTLATLGYGDIVPANEITRAVAIVEAIAGQLYLAVMMARLVSLYVGGSRQK